MAKKKKIAKKKRLCSRSKESVIFTHLHHAEQLKKKKKSHLYHLYIYIYTIIFVKRDFDFSALQEL